ncbi:hypothetical protein [Anthocerotibacter panamensis]|uniref:hypothetical protein n=1 Tax=Anthocerotibacter panamensis TaxID=2857077 RepID=UPI001C403E76|nr:hypothetical protein [Anthocerotibacter panamensis]
MTSTKVPLMFRAQIQGRCQLQYPPSNDAQTWAYEWVVKASDQVPRFGVGVKTRPYTFNWRFVTNSGQDEGVIRPVIGARGWPFYPGASMKGAFRRVCPPELVKCYCGDDEKLSPGILRFHGGYPVDNRWTDRKRLVDVVHPQESWQIRHESHHSASAQISLYQPTLAFGISSNTVLSEEKWAEIWNVWERALGLGLGSRVSAGYGQLKVKHENALLTVNLKGQGPASMLVNKSPEFRPNMFKAALRGHTLRLLGGLTDAGNAETITKELWGGFAERNGAIVGKLGIAFDARNLELDRHGNNQLPVYELEQGTLSILAMKSLEDLERQQLAGVTGLLVRFTMLLGGFGKSWRRVDHRLFFNSYATQPRNPMIGCHWEFNSVSRNLYYPVNELAEVTSYLKKIRGAFRSWLKSKDVPIIPEGSNWCEAWHPDHVQVWGRLAPNGESQAVKWFHGPYQGAQTIKGSALAGKMGQIGRIWHRMYPRTTTNASGVIQGPNGYVELLTIFPDDSSSTRAFLEFLQTRSEFEKVWPL